ncbi:MAG TPA: 2-oxo-4-hydroxy-4-carboxy-5-ureidoimidazoline decarboxylase [Kiritimatiellia bacterium]|nr:2-oxo-4-hydroxy-4-carboxy-5-ureidoimidazoline decarboxylase [Kiritimatiellia bacterium]
MTLDELNALTVQAALPELIKCCGSQRWAKAMCAARPFVSVDALHTAADGIWNGLSVEDWREAFTHHPKIGDIDSLRKKFATTADWASGEQSGVNQANEETLRGLAEGNRAYEETFGYIFIVCATGKSAGEMLEMLRSRLSNPPDLEIRVAGAEQQKITRIRLDKLLSN